MILHRPRRKEQTVAQGEFRQGDTVEWNTPQGKTRGKVKKKLTSPTQGGGQNINASEGDPPYPVESENIGKEAENKPDYPDGDNAHMRRVVGYVRRHQAKMPNGDVENSNWRFSLMNWGHDPL